MARPLVRPFEAPHFVALVQKGLGDDDRGAAIVTTLDLDLQRETEALVAAHLASIEDRGARNAAVLVVDNASGDVLAYAGSADFDDERIDGQVDMIQARRQPGSTLKPFFYELAFERGHDSGEMLADVPSSFGSPGERRYVPRDQDGVLAGPVRAREALAGSLNVPAVRLLADLGPEPALARLHELGFASLDRDARRYGLTLALGTGEVKLYELAGAYVALARAGERIPLRTRVTDPSPLPRRVMAAEAAASVTEILADPTARTRLVAGEAPFDPGFPVAVKTGTSAGYRDALCAGYTRERTVVVWVGNADGERANDLSGTEGAGPLFAEVMRRAMEDVASPAPLFDPALLEDAEVCPLSGRRPGPACPDRVHLRFARGHTPPDTCAVHVKVSPDPGMPGRVPYRCDPAGEQTIALLPPLFTGWLRAQPDGAPGRDPFGIPWYPAGWVPGCTAEPNEPAEVRITSPVAGTVFVVSNVPPPARRAIEVRASARGGNGGRPTAVDFFLDGRPVARSRWPYSAHIEPAPGEHEIVALPADPQERATVRPARFTVW
ncbi:MAG: penicillin-binding transpeptidase domain-containing protein [Polyangiaceae bacterium]